MTERVRESWESRALESGTELSGVLFRGLSSTANGLLHAWHAWIVSTLFLPKIGAGGRILDLGCGYGRLRDVIATRRPDVEIVGQDLAMGYCRLYAKTGTPCVQGDARWPPFSDGVFDGVLAVTCLMYAVRENVPAVLDQLRRVTKPGGALLTLDPGAEMQTLIGHLRGRGSQSPTGGRGFTRGEYRALVTRSGFEITADGGNPYLSMALLVPGIATSPSTTLSAMLSHIARRDLATTGYSRLALHRWLLANRTEQRA